MNKSEFMTKITRTVNKAGFEIKKHSPEILVVTGVVGVVASTVMACKATLKINDILDDAKDSIEKIHYGVEHPEELPEVYTVEDSKKDLAIIYAQTGLKLAKEYAPAVILGSLSIYSIVKSHDILRKRNVALASAYAIVDKGFKEYRSRVVERFGKDLDHELRYNIKAQEVEETVVDKKGKEKTVTKTVNAVDPSTNSDYSKFFDASCAGWTKDAEWNLTFLKAQQAYANERLKAKGHVFLNEVYDMLGIDRTKAGNIVGWIYDEVHPVGDNFIDFGIYNQDSERVRAFVNGYENVILLDFNVDGPILNNF